MNEEKKGETLGEFLKKELEKKNLSIKDLHEKTKISNKFLNIIINDDYENYPPSVYLKGYLKKIALVLNIDFSYIYENFVSNIEKDKTVEITPKYKPILSVEKKRSSFKFLFIFLLIIALILIVYFSLKKTREIKKVKNIHLEMNPKPKVKIKVKKEIINKIKDNKSTKLIKTPVITSIDNQTKILKIIPEELTWVRVIIDNITVKKLFLKKGDNVTFEGKKFFKLDIGNAGGIKLIFNNKELGYPGKRGEVKHIILK